MDVILSRRFDVDAIGHLEQSRTHFDRVATTTTATTTPRNTSATLFSTIVDPQHGGTATGRSIQLFRL